MKKIFRNLKLGLMLCAGAFAASCSDVDEAMNEIPYTRVLTPLNFEADVDAAVGTDIKFSWSAVSNADAYILELFEAVPTIKEEDGKEVEIYEMPENFDSSNAYQTIEVAKDGVPFTVKNLAVDKTFWARVQGVSAKIESSHWAYLVEAVSTSAVRSALNPKAKERTETTVTVQWDQNAKDPKDLTSIRYELVVPVEGATATVMPLSDEQISACEAKIENLEPGTNYKFTLLFGKSGSRGHFTAYTRPSTEGTQIINNSAELYNALSSATGDLKLLLAYNNGTAYDLKSYLTTGAGTTDEKVSSLPLAHTLYLYGESAPDGNKPVMKNFQFELSGNDCHAIHMEDVNLDGGKNFGYIISIDKNGSATLPESVEFVNCEIVDFTKGIFTISSDGTTVDGKCERFLIENVYAHDINPTGSGGGDFIDARKGSFGSVEIKNSTFYASARSFIRFSETTCSIEGVNVANCTFNQVTATNTSNNNSGIFHIRFTPTSKPDNFQKLNSFTLTKCVFLNMNNANETESSFWVRLTRDSNENFAPKCAGNYYYNVGHLYENKNGGQNTFFPTKSLLEGEPFTAAMALAEGGVMLTEDPCTNSIAGKLYLKNGAIAANKAGDPRWWNASAPVVVRPTELEPIAEAAAWDFTDKTKFYTETVENQTIIENIRIYGPAEIVMSTGISFAQAATITNKGVPTASAFEFKADGYGSIEMTAQGKSVTSTVQIVAGGDTYSIIADGKPHKVVLGDLVGVNSIYVLPGSDNTSFTRIAWTKDTTPENTVTALATPVLTLNETSIDEGTQQAVTATWERNAHAEKYTVTFNGTTTEVTEPAFEIPAATIAALAAGEYTISVVAQPTSTSTKYTPSEAGEAKFKIKKVIAGGLVSLKWNFDDEAFADAKAAIGTTDNKAADTYFNGLHIESLGGTLKVEDRGKDGWFLRTGGGGKINSRRVSFVVLKNGPGTLKVTGANPSGSTTDETELTITANINEGEKILTGKLVGKGIKEVVIFDGEELKANDVVYIYTSGGIRYKQFEYTYVDPDAGPTQKELVWD